jgi:autotransporter strand-loop-strand O-heptosyltransferase
MEQNSKTDFGEDIFVIDTWPNNESKENELIALIERLRIYNIPILLAGHYPIKPEIQKIADYCLYDRNNPLLITDEFADFGVNSVRWSDMKDFHIENLREYHHDYAVWETMRNAFNFAKYLGKKYIHFMDDDNLPHPIQYRQTFLERIRDFDVVITEYDKDSSLITNEKPYCTTYIFSIRTDIAVKVFDTIKTKDEFFRNKPDIWQLEKNFLSSVRKITNSIYICKYIPNHNEFNMHSAWERPGMYRNKMDIQIYLAIMDIDDLYLHAISGGDYLIEVSYENYKKFHNVTKNSLFVYELGKYQQGSVVTVYYMGTEIYSNYLTYDIEKFRKLNTIIKKIKNIEEMNKNPLRIVTNFIDGPFVEIIFNNIDRLYHVQFINKKNNHIEFELDLKTNHWAKCSKKYYIDWLIKIRGIDHDYYSEYEMNYTGKRVLISFESKSLGDTLAWIGYVEKFRTVHGCTVICSTFHNNLFKGQYPEIEFVDPGTTVPNVYGVYRLGVFKKTGYKPDPNSPNEVDYDKHLTDPKMEPLTKVASDILGLDYVEIKPKLPVFTQGKKKIVSIAIHGTAQCKYWNNPIGWQQVVDFLIKNGYEVKLLSSEEDGFMGNKNPNGVTTIRNKSLEQILKIIQESELFIGISSGLSWLAWGARTETILISGFTDVYTEPTDGIRRIINKNVCNSCWSKFDFNPADWNWCPVHKGTVRQFECSKTITSQQVINEIKEALKISD